MKMRMLDWRICLSAVVAVVAALAVCGSADTNSSTPKSNLTLEYNYTYFHDRVSHLVLKNESIMYWKPNQTNDPATQLMTNAYIFEPDTNSTGYRFSTIGVTFLGDCKLSLSAGGDYPVIFLMYPFSYATVSPEFGAEFQDLPSFCQEVTHQSFNNSNIYEKNFSSGELFIGFRGIAKVMKKADGSYFVRQTNVSSCTIIVQAYGPLEMVPSLTLFYGILVLILVPALLTIIAHFVMLVCQRNAPEKSEAGFKRVTCECRLFWVTWVGAFALFIGVVLVPMY